MKPIEEIIKNTTEENQEKTDWTRAWSSKYPILKTYQSEVDIPKYAAQIRSMLTEIQQNYGYSEQDAMLVLKDILAHEYMDNRKWKCPKCGREFRKKNQEHYCGEKPKTIEEYILSQDPEKQEDLRKMQTILRDALPGAEERISWSMPTYWKGHNILHFAASKKHIGFYPGSEAVDAFSEELTGYKTDKGTIRIPYGKIDDALISRIAKWCIETENHA